MGGVISSPAAASSSPPTIVSLGFDAGAPSLGTRHACAQVFPSGEARCWGSNSNYQAGSSSTLPIAPFASFVPFPGDRVRKVCAGNFSTCALLSDAGITCFGDNQGCELTNAATPCPATPSNLVMSHVAMGPAIDLACNERHACGLERDGGVTCWGNNGNLQAIGRDAGSGVNLVVTPTHVAL